MEGFTWESNTWGVQMNLKYIKHQTTLCTSPQKTLHLKAEKSVRMEWDVCVKYIKLFR